MPQPAVARVEAGRVSPTAATIDRLLRPCGMRLSVEERPGRGIDRSVIRRLLALSPAERLQVAVAEARNLAALR
jgi:hypothetical protein